MLGEAEREDAPEWKDVAAAVVVAGAVGRLAPPAAEAYVRLAAFFFFFFLSHVFDLLSKSSEIVDAIVEVASSDDVGLVLVSGSAEALKRRFISSYVARRCLKETSLASREETL